MLKSDLADETKAELLQSGPVELLLGISAPVNAAALHERVRGLANGAIVAYPDDGSDQGLKSDADAAAAGFMRYALTGFDTATPPWVVSAAAQRTICSLAVELNAKACIILHGDLEMLTADRLQILTQAIHEKQCDLVLPVYQLGKFDGLLNHGILAPLARALYGQRVKYPLARDFGCSARMFQKLSELAVGRERGDGLLWPATQAAMSSYQVCQAIVDMHHPTQIEGLELSDVLASLVGSAFAEMETYAPHWQRVRNSQPAATFGNAAQKAGDGEPVDAKPLIESFMLGSRNLQEIWRLVLPPVTLLELKKLSRCTAESFRMPDEVWVRIIYDFALAYRLRTINRGHLMGALTPLYLGWVASYVQEVAARSPQAAEQRLEQLARAYEEGKPYLVSRWRWPDRFNP